MDIGFVPLKSDVEIGASKPEGRDASATRMLGGPGPIKRLGWNEERDVVPIHRWVRRFEIRTRWNGAMVQRHRRFHDPGNARSGFEMANLRFDGAYGHFSCTVHVRPQTRQR